MAKLTNEIVVDHGQRGTMMKSRFFAQSSSNRQVKTGVLLWGGVGLYIRLGKTILCRFHYILELCMTVVICKKNIPNVENKNDVIMVHTHLLIKCF